MNKSGFYSNAEGLFVGVSHRGGLKRRVFLHAFEFEKIGDFRPKNVVSTVFVDSDSYQDRALQNMRIHFRDDVFKENIAKTLIF